jgi:cobalt-zinc-cadmium efflux system outer membrane protein
MISPKLRHSCAKTTALRVAGLSLAWAISALAVQAETLPLSVAMTRAATADPSLSANAQRLHGAEGSLLQAGMRPNPRLDLQVENLLGSEPYGGIDRTETTLTYQQTLERGDKRQARTGVARAERDLIVANGRIKLFDLMTGVQALWIEAVVAEAEARLAQDRLVLAKQAQTEVTRRVKAARDPLFAGSLADSDVAQAQIAVDQTRQKADAIKAQIAAYWNGPADFELDPAWLEDLSTVNVTPTLMETPEIERLRALQRIATAQIGLETSKRAQDPTVEAGMRHFKADGAVAFVVGGSIPLGRYDTNQGAIARAQAEADAATTDIEASERVRLREIAAITPRLVSYAEEVRRIDVEVIPQAQRAVTQVREGFARGGFSYRDVTGAQDALIGIRARRLAILKTFQSERARREQLAGQWVPLIPVQDAN